MHLELPQGRLKSLRDFAKHYLMIVLSILTALGLEALIEHAHHRHAAETASRRMDHELRDDLDGIGASLQVNQQTLDGLRTLDRMVVQNMQAGVSSAEINRQIRTGQNLFLINLNWPTLSTNAWDVAVADQSASWIDAPALQRYSVGYSAVREMASWVQHDATLFFNGPSMADLRTDLATGQPVDAREFLHQLRQLETTIKATQNALRSEQRQLRKALGMAPASEESAPHAAP